MAFNDFQILHIEINKNDKISTEVHFWSSKSIYGFSFDHFHAILFNTNNSLKKTQKKKKFLFSGSRY